MTQNDPLGGLRQGTAAVGALAKPLDAALPGAGSTLQTMLQLAAMSLPTYVNHTPINPYNTNPMGVVGFRNLGGTLDPTPKEKKKVLHNNIIQSINQGAAQGLSYDQIIQSIDPLLLQKDAVLESMIRPSFDSSNIPNESVKALYPGRFFNLGGNIPGIGMYLNGGNLDQQITKDSFKVQGNSGIDTNFRNVEGQQALLTKNEVVSKLKDGSNYVFSDHIKNPLTGNSLAKDVEKLKKRQKQAEDRAASGDLISKKTVGKIKEQVDELSKINDMALEVIKETMGEQADAFLCGGKMKSKNYALGGVVKKVLGGTSELPQQEPITPEMTGWWGAPSVSQVPVITPTPDPVPVVPPFNSVAPYPKQGDFWYGVNPNVRAGIENFGTGLAQGFMDYSTRIGRYLYGPGFQLGDIGPLNAMARNYVNPAPPSPTTPSRSRGIGMSAYTPPTDINDPAVQDILFGWRNFAPPSTPVASTTNDIPTLTESELAAGTTGTPATKPARSRSGSTTKSSKLGLDYVPGTEALGAMPNSGRLSIEDVKAGKSLSYTDPNWKGVKTIDFQKFVAAKDPKALSKFGTDGKWGKETEAAWNKYGKEYLTSIGKFGTPASPSIATIPPYLINQKNPDLTGPDTEKKDKDSGANFTNFQKYIGDVMQGLAFAGQLGNLGTVEWENIPKMDLRQIDPTIYQEQLRAARNAQMQNVAGSYSANQAGQQAAYSQYLNQLTQTLQQVDTTNKQLATETQSYNNQADVQQQIARMQALAAHDAAKQNIWGSFANAGQAINQQYSNQVGQAALASAYPLVYEGLMKDMQEFLSANNKKKTKTSE